MPTEENILQYLYFKGISSIVFSNDYTRQLEKVSSIIQLDSIGSIQVLEEISETFQDIMDNQMKANISSLIMYYRFDYCEKNPDDKKEVYDIANRIIYNINSCSMKKSYPFVYNELNIRRSKRISIPNLIRYFPDYWQLVKTEITDDFFVLYAQTEYFSDESFVSILEKLTDEDFGYASKVLSILSEFPSLIKDKTFGQRTKTTIGILESRIANPKESKETMGEIAKVKKITRKVGEQNV